MKKPLPSFARLTLNAVFCALLLLAINTSAQVSSTNTISGTISVPGEQDVFTFSLTNRTRYYFDSLTNVSTVNWSLEGPTGTLVDKRSFRSSDAGSQGAVMNSLVPGYYQLTIDCDNSNTNSYAFRWVDLASAALLTPDTIVSNRLSPGNETHLY